MIQQFYIWGEWTDSNNQISILHPYDGHEVGQVYMAESKHIDQAILSAHQYLSDTKKLSPYEKVEILDFIVKELTAQAEEFAQLLMLENGKTIKEARLEVDRTISTFRIARAEAERIDGDSFDLWATKYSKGHYGIVKKFPIWVVVGIVPFNFPLNLWAHKIAPALATWCPIIIKPATQTSLSMIKFAKIIERSWRPKGAFSVIPCDRVVWQQLVEDDRIALLSFTWSPEVGRKMKSQSGKKKVVLELWGNAWVIIDDTEQDTDHIVSRIITGAYYQAGQVCISVQRIYIHSKYYDTIKFKLVSVIGNMKIGDPSQEDTDMWSVIDQKNTDRLVSWIDQAVSDWANCLIWGKAKGTLLAPTLLENVNWDMDIVSQEAFWPVAVLYKFDTIDQVIDMVNDSKFGLQVGIFSKDINHVWQVFDQVEVWWVIHDDVPSFRSDSMPYGGVKDSWLGREGVRYAMQDMLEDKVLVIKG